MQPLEMSPPDNQFTFAEKDLKLIDTPQGRINALKRCLDMREKELSTKQKMNYGKDIR